MGVAGLLTGLGGTGGLARPVRALLACFLGDLGQLRVVLGTLTCPLGHGLAEALVSGQQSAAQFTQDVGGDATVVPVGGRVRLDGGVVALAQGGLGRLRLVLGLDDGVERLLQGDGRCSVTPAAVIAPPAATRPAAAAAAAFAERIPDTNSMIAIGASFSGSRSAISDDS
jgi:hypothetical protein